MIVMQASKELTKALALGGDYIIDWNWCQRRSKHLV